MRSLRLLRSRCPRVELVASRGLAREGRLPAFLAFVVPHLVARATAQTSNAMFGADEVVVAARAGLVETGRQA